MAAQFPPYVPNATSVRELMMLWYGTPFETQPDESDYTIGATATVLGVTKGQVVSRLVSNTGLTNFAISYKPTVTIATGFLIEPGGTYRDDWYYDGDLMLRPLYAISSGAGGTLHMLERSLYGG